MVLKRSTLLDIIKVNGYSITAWLEGAEMLTASPLTTMLASDWLAKWSLDLRVLSDDHDLRNIVSYNPQDIKKRLRYTKDSKKELKFLIEKWRLSEPSASEKFSKLDYHLLKEALHKFYFEKYPIAAARPTLKKFIRDIFFRIGAPNNANLEVFLSSSNKLNSIVLLESSKVGIAANGIINPFSIMARAFLLLRMATASVESLLSYAGYNNTLLQFWWKDILEKKGLWDLSTTPLSMLELWDDVAISINNITPILNASACNKLILKDRFPIDNITLRQFQRAHLWGIGL